MLEGLANIAFLLNAFNMIPIGFLDGGRRPRRARIVADAGHPIRGRCSGAGARADRTRAVTIVALYLGLAGLLVIGMLATHPTGGL